MVAAVTSIPPALQAGVVRRAGKAWMAATAAAGGRVLTWGRLLLPPLPGT